MLKTLIAGTRVPTIYVLEQNKKITCTPATPAYCLVFRLFVKLVVSSFGLGDVLWVLIAPVLDHYIRVTFIYFLR